MEAADTFWRWTQSRRRLPQVSRMEPSSCCRATPSAVAAADALGQGGPVVLMPPLCPVRLLLPCFLALEEPPGREERQEQGTAPV